MFRVKWVLFFLICDKYFYMEAHEKTVMSRSTLYVSNLLFGALLVTFVAGIAGVYGAEIPQSGAIVTDAGEVMGLINISSDGQKIHIDAVTEFTPPEGKVYEGWLVDNNQGASKYTLDVGQFNSDGQLVYDANLVNAYTYTDFGVTAEPIGDADPRPDTSYIVGYYKLAPPFGK